MLEPRWPPPSTGCFTLISPAASAEGLCLYNSGYLHWVRKPTSHEHHLTRSFISNVHCGRNATVHFCSYAPKPPFQLQEGSLSVQHVDRDEVHVDCTVWLFGKKKNTTALFTTEKCWQVLFKALLRRRTGIHTTSSADPLQSCLGLNVSGCFGGKDRRRATLTQIEIYKLEFSSENLLVAHIAAKYHPDVACRHFKVKTVHPSALSLSLQCVL